MLKNYHGSESCVYGTGYDEYKGIFGPLSADPIKTQSNGHSYPTVRSSYRTKRWRKQHLSLLPQNYLNLYEDKEFSTRAKYLKERKTSNNLKPGTSVDSDDNSITPDLKQNNGSQQLVLPSKKFVFRQRAGKLDTRTISRIDLQKIIDTTDIETIQRHLENLAFADVTLDDVQHYSDSYFLKLFQIAQLSVEYLLHVQESLANQSELLESQCNEIFDECKSLEAENEKIEAEVIQLKKEIRQKQRTLATLEVMLVNCAPSTALNTTHNKDGLGSLNEENSQLHENENSTIKKSLAKCDECGKKFISSKYLARHQAKYHADAADTDAVKTKESANTSIVRPIDLNEILTKKFDEMNKSVLDEKVARLEAQRQTQKAQEMMSNQFNNTINKLTELFTQMQVQQQQNQIEMKKLTEEVVAKQLQTYTKEQQEKFMRHKELEMDLELERQKKLGKKSQGIRMGEIVDDDDTGECESNKAEEKKESNKRNDEINSMMKTILQIQQQTQLDMKSLTIETMEIRRAQECLERTYKKELRHRKREPSHDVRSRLDGGGLLDMVELEANRFGLDYGLSASKLLTPTISESDTLNAKQPIPTNIVVQEAKELIMRHQEREKCLNIPSLIRADQTGTTAIENNGPFIIESASKETAKCCDVNEVPTGVILTDDAESQEIDLEAPIITKPVEQTCVCQSVKPQDSLTSTENLVKICESAPMVAIMEKDHVDKEKAALLLTKVIRGFITRKKLRTPNSWKLSLQAEFLQSVFEDELTSGEEVNDDNQKIAFSNISIDLQSNMTISQLREALISAISTATWWNLSSPLAENRVLVVHTTFGAKLADDLPISQYIKEVEVQILPPIEILNEHIDQVIESHKNMSSNVRNLRRDEVDAIVTNVEPQDVEKIIRLQALFRGNLAKRQAGTMRLEKWISAKLGHNKDTAPSTTDDKKNIAAKINLIKERVDQLAQEAARKEAIEFNVLERNDVEPSRKRKIGRLDELPTGSTTTNLMNIHNKSVRLTEEVNERINQLNYHVDTLVEKIATTDSSFIHLDSRAATRYPVDEIRKMLNAAVDNKPFVSPIEKASMTMSIAASANPEGKANVDMKSSIFHNIATSLPMTNISIDVGAATTSHDFDEKEIENLANAYEEGNAHSSLVEIFSEEGHFSKQREPVTRGTRGEKTDSIDDFNSSSEFSMADGSEHPSNSSMEDSCSDATYTEITQRRRSETRKTNTHESSYEDLKSVESQESVNLTSE